MPIFTLSRYSLLFQTRSPEPLAHFSRGESLGVKSCEQVRILLLYFADLHLFNAINSWKWHYEVFRWLNTFLGKAE